MLVIGRSSSHFTRLPRVIAEEVGVQLDFKPVYDMTSLDESVYAGNPALKLPILRTEDDVIFGALNIARTLAEHAGQAERIVWPEELTSVVSRNAQELVWHGMAAQVQLVIGTAIAKLPAENVFFAKARAGFEGTLRWLDAHVSQALNELPSARTTSVFEVSLFCLIEHLAFRPTISVAPYSALAEFAHEFAARPSAQRTPYRIDQ